MKRLIFTILCVFTALNFHSQEQKNTLSILFVGDIMGHQPQIDAAFNPETKSYNYEAVFQRVKPIFEQMDFVVGNLELTLAGKPYKGYPQFSSPDELAKACYDAGMKVMVTANNHSCDRGKKGILRTLKVLDSLQIRHTGTFSDSLDYQQNNLLKLSANGIQIGILNYTYGTNGIPIPKPTIVNLIDFEKMKTEIQSAKNQQLDKLIVFIHWGDEYQSLPNNHQKEVADFLFENGVDVIIGSHPHILQPMIFTPKTSTENEKLLIYSLGNFVSNQRTSPRDGGAMYQIVFEKNHAKTQIKNHGYHLTWVRKSVENNRPFFEILPCKEYENLNDFLSEEEKRQMEIFTKNARNLFQNHNKNVEEL